MKTLRQQDQQYVALIEYLFGEQSWGSAVHPLRKAECKLCHEWVMEKERVAHATGHDKFLNHSAPSVEDIDGMHAEWLKGLTPEDRYNLNG